MTSGDGAGELAAFATEAERIRAIADPEEAFREAGKLVERHSALRGAAAKLRAEQARRVYESEPMSVITLSKRLGVTKQRAAVLLSRAAEAAAEQTRRPEPQPVVSAVVTSRKGVLVTKRRDGRPPWAFVGGEIDQGESPEDAGLRELKEETGLLGVSHGEIGRRIHPATGRTIVYMAVRPARGVTSVHVGDESELEEVRWVGLAEARELMPDMYGPVAEHLARTLR